MTTQEFKVSHLYPCLMLVITMFLVGCKPVIDSFTASPEQVHYGESVTLAWQTTDVTSLKIEPDIGEVDPVSMGDITFVPRKSQTYTLIATGENGDVVESQVTVTVIEPSSIQMTPSSGDAPLTVSFTPQFTGDTTAERIYWDFDGLGGPVTVEYEGQTFNFKRISGASGKYYDYDVSSLTHRYSFNQPGTYYPKMLVQYSNGGKWLATAELEVTNQPPQVTATVSQTTGPAPLTVYFNVNATDSDGIEVYLWDFNGDGQTDLDTHSSLATHTYTIPGLYPVQLTVKDRLDAQTTISLPHMQIEAGQQGDPGIIFSASSLQGTAPFNTEFTIQAQIDEGVEITRWEIDPFGDENWQSLTSKETEFVHSVSYEQVGKFYPKVRLTTDQNKTVTAVLEITVGAQVLLEVRNRAFDPNVATQVSEVVTTISGGVQLSIVIEDKQGQRVKTLVDNQLRQANQTNGGQFIDQWSGTDDSGKIVAPGDYYAVLLYQLGNSQQRVDLRQTTGNKRFYPRDPNWTSRCKRTDAGVNCGTLRFSDSAPQPMAQNPVTYYLSNPNYARFSAYHSVYQSNLVVNHLFRDLVLAPGDYQFTWNGESNDNQLLPVINSRYLITALGYTLADNVIVLTHLPLVTDMRLTTSVFNPLANVAPNFGQFPINYTLAANADVVFEIYEMTTGTKIHGYQQTAVPAGEQTSYWDGRLTGGLIAPAGNYFIAINASSGGVMAPTEKLAFRIKY